MNRRDFVVSAVAMMSAACVLGATAVKSSEGDATPVKGGTLIWGHSENTQNLDIHQTGAASSQRVLQNIHASIVTIDKDFQIIPGLAESFDISPDGLTYTFKLRPGVKFHDGAAMTSADVKYSFERVMDPATGAVSSDVFSSVTEIATPDDSTVVIALSKVYAPFLARLAENGAGAIIPAGSGDIQGATPTGAGPFKFSSYEVGNKLELVRFDDYWEGPALLDKLVAREITEPTVRLTGLRTGELHLINDIPADRIGELEADDQFSTFSWFPLNWDFVTFNHAFEPFTNKNVRLAFDLLIDKQQLLDGALWGQGKPTASPSYPTSPSYNSALTNRAQDIAEATRLLTEAGYAPGTLNLTFKVTNNYPYQVEAAQIMAEWLAQGGVTMTIEQLTWGDWLTQVWTNKDFELTMINVFTFWEPDFLYYGIWHSDGAFNYRNIKDATVDALIEEARITVDQDKRNELYKQVQQRIFDEVLDVVLWFRNGAIGAQANVMGLDTIVHPNGSNMNFQKVWFKA